MPVGFNISDQDVEYAASVLLTDGHHFDEEQVTFIKDLRTLDLQAVPGSGKTTALLAKLLILARYLPFADGSGVLVLSHTNAAIDEIRDRLASHCPKLFSYPNFIGTIQGFVDRFLTIPYYSTVFKSEILRIDDESHVQYASQFSSGRFSNFTNDEQNQAKRFLRINDLFKTVRIVYSGESWILTNNGKPLEIKKPHVRNERSYSDWTPDEKENVRRWILQFKYEILSKGILSYDDAYMLALSFIRDYPREITLLRGRFQLVFVDEMQDIDKKQHDLLEAIFGDISGICAFQRIGDKNQAIFNGSVSLDDVWSIRATVLPLSGSQRLNPNIARIVEPLGLIPVSIIGKRKNRDGTDIDIKPHIIKYTDATIHRVIPTFATVISELREAGKMPVSESAVFKAIGWRKKREAGKPSISSYYPDYNPEQKPAAGDHAVLESYLLQLSMDDKSMGVVSESLMRGILRVLRLENVRDDSRKHLSKATFCKTLLSIDEAAYQVLRLHLYNWSIGIIRGSHDAVLEAIRQYLPTLLGLFEKRVAFSQEFVDGRHQVDPATTSVPVAVGQSNIVEHSGVRIEVATVHSVKGQTHTATLYLETFYSTGRGNFESQRLSPPLLGEPLVGNQLKVVKQSARMAYVGFSRPTHLLCFAVHQDRFEAKLSGISSDNWVVVDA